MEFLITTIVAVILPVGVVSECPSLCVCTGDNDCRWDCVRVQQFIMIDGKIAVVFSSVL